MAKGFLKQSLAFLLSFAIISNASALAIDRYDKSVVMRRFDRAILFGEMLQRVGAREAANVTWQDILDEAKRTLGERASDYQAIAHKVDISRSIAKGASRPSLLELEAAAERQDRLGKSTDTWRIAHLSLADKYLSAAMYEQARKHYKLVLADAKTPDDFKIAALTQLSITEEACKQYAAAFDWNKQALLILSRMPQPSVAVYATTLTISARLHSELGKIDEAIALYRQTLAFMSARHFESYDLQCNTLFQIGALLSQKKRYSESIEALKQCLHTAERSKNKGLGPAYQAAILLSIAAQAAAGKHSVKERLSYLEDATSRAVKSEVPELLLKSLCNTASALSLSDWIRAQSLANQAIAIADRNTACPRDSRITAYLQAGNLYFVKGKYSQANTLYKKALAIAKRSPALPPQVFAALVMLTGSNFFAGNFSEARRYSQFTEQVAASGEIGPGALGSYYQTLGLILWLAGNDADSEQAFKTSAERYKKAGITPSNLLQSGLEWYYSHYVADAPMNLQANAATASKISQGIEKTLGPDSLYGAAYFKLMSQMFAGAGLNREAAHLSRRAQNARRIVMNEPRDLK